MQIKHWYWYTWISVFKTKPFGCITEYYKRLSKDKNKTLRLRSKTEVWLNVWDSIQRETIQAERVWNIHNIFQAAVHSSVQFKAASSQHQNALPSPKNLKVHPIKLLLLRTHWVLLSETLLDGHIREKATDLLDEARVDLRAEGHVQQL